MTNPGASLTSAPNGPAASGTAASGANRVTDALQQVLATEHAAVYGYPVVGVRLSDSAQIQRARDLEAAHRQFRDAVMAQLARLAVAPVAAQPTYPQAGTAPPSGSEAAFRSAVAIEEQCASAYRYLLTAAVGAGNGEQPVRVQAMTGLVTAAANATAWRSLVVPTKPTVALPGL